MRTPAAAAAKGATQHVGAAWHANRPHDVPASSRSYDPRRPDTVLHRLVQTHFETFRREAEHLRDGDGLPRFVEQEFREFLRCGWLAGGFARLRCGACGHDRLVAFSCKGRGFCPSCGGRRMADRTTHLVDRVLPDVPIRQWVLTVPHALRFQLAWDHALCRAVVGALLRAVTGALRRRARLAGVADGRSGAVAVIQRFGGALNLHVHVHALVLDGVYARGPSGELRFHPADPFTARDVDDVLATVEAYVGRVLARRRRTSEDGDDGGWHEEAPLLAGLAAASVQGAVALGAARRLRMAAAADREDADDACRARSRGFDLHAGLWIPAGQRGRLERVCQYVLRPPVATERVTLTETGQVRLALRRPWSNDTTHLEFEPVAFLAPLAVLVPRPRVNLVLYYGVLAPRAAWRSVIVPNAGGDECRSTSAPESDASDAEVPLSARGYRWAELLRRTFDIDVLCCPRCGGRLVLIALIEQPEVIARILGHLGLPSTLPRPAPARRAPRGGDEWQDDVPVWTEPT